MKKVIYAILALIYLVLIILALIVGTSWFNKFFIIFGLVYFGGKFMDCLDD